MNVLATQTVSQVQAPSGDPRSEDVIICRDVHKWYGGYHAVRGVTTRILQGETVVIVGPSGSGKSTFLRTLNQTEEHQRGDIIVDGVLLNRNTRNIDAVRRNIGMVSQDFNLFPHMSILDNITLAPQRVLKEDPVEARERAMEILGRVGIPEQAGKLPHQLSSGEQQLAAIARALAMKPRIMLLDEPTSAMDADMGKVLRSHARARPVPDDGGGRHPRDGLRPGGRRPHRLLRRGPDSRGPTPGGILPEPQEQPRQNGSWKRYSSNATTVYLTG